MRVRLTMLGAVVVLLSVGCAPGDSTVGGSGGSTAAGGGASGAAGGNGTAGGAAPICYDTDHDGVTTCDGDCNDADPSIHPGAIELANGKDDDCDGKVDNHIAGQDYDHDGTPYPADCNDDEPLIGPNAIENSTNMVDDNCNGVVDETVSLCDDAATGTTAADYAKAIGLCSVSGSAFPAGDASARAIRTGFGTSWMPRAGSKLVMLSSGTAVDDNDQASYNPQPGKQFNTTNPHPLWSPPAPKCGLPSTPVTTVHDMTELSITLKVPQNAKSFSYNFAFFSAEYPEFVCTEFNDRFITILQSSALDPTALPTGQCLPTAAGAQAQCNISYDMQGQPVTINNGFFDVCDTYNGPNYDGTTVSNTCTKSSSLLAQTGYDRPDGLLGAGHSVGGGTGWLSTKAPVKPNETITLRFIIFDEGDGKLDSAVLIDNFQWAFDSVAAPTTQVTVN